VLTVVRHAIPALFVTPISWLTSYVVLSLMAAFLLTTKDSGRRTLTITNGLR
jgi:hypothetical protein